MGVTVDINCLCGRSEGRANVAAKSLPVETLLCHCNTCRYSSGVLCVSYLTLESPPALMASLTTYHSSENMERYFCGACGSHNFAHSLVLHEWYLAIGAIETSDPNVPGRMMETLKLARHEFVSDTLDGGLAPCLAQVQGRQPTFFAQGPDQAPLSVRSDGHHTLMVPAKGSDKKEQAYAVTSVAEDQLHASCHCGGVQFRLSRPNELSRQLSSPWPDLLRAYHSASSENQDDVKWWLHSDGRRYIAGTCACNSCRLASGFPIQTWAFVPKANLTSLDGQPLSFDLGSMKQYHSSPGTYREFCATCGATAFWHCDERPKLIDVSVGLLRAEEGARADTWLKWATERVSFKEDAIDKELMGALEAGLSNINRD